MNIGIVKSISGIFTTTINDELFDLEVGDTITSDMIVCGNTLVASMEVALLNGQTIKVTGRTPQKISFEEFSSTDNSLKSNHKEIPQETEPKEENTLDIQNILLQEKDNQIQLIKDLMNQQKDQYEKEIQRLEKSHNQTIEVFKSKVGLLQSAFNEMKKIYSIEQKPKESNETNIEFLDIKAFFSLMKNYNKTNEQIKYIILNRIAKNDKRFIYDANKKDLKIFKSDFLDLI
jgi:ATP-dependent Lon protease